MKCDSENCSVLWVNGIPKSRRGLKSNNKYKICSHCFEKISEIEHSDYGHVNQLTKVEIACDEAFEKRDW